MQSAKVLAITLPLVTVYALIPATITCGQSKPLLERLTTEGITIIGDSQFALPQVTLREGMTEEQRSAALEKLAGNDGWTRFSRDSVVAPVTIELEYIKNSSGERTGHHVHSAYAVHAKLETLRDQDLMQQLFGVGPEKDASGGMSFTPLTEQELGDAAVASDAPNVSFGRLSLLLLGKIQIRGIVRLERIETANQVTIAWYLLPQFGKTEPQSATWTKIEANEVGEKQPTATQLYSGMAGYMNVSRAFTTQNANASDQSAEASDVLVIESQLLMHEPQDWFSGSNFVRSKLPLGIQESARNFRRKLARRN